MQEGIQKNSVCDYVILEMKINKNCGQWLEEKVKSRNELTEGLKTI